MGLKEASEHSAPTLHAPPIPASPEEVAVLKLKQSLEKASGMGLSELRNTMTFLEMGFDSLFLTQWAFSLKNEQGIQVQVQRLFDDLSTLEAMAKYILLEAPEFGVECPHPPHSNGVSGPQWLVA